ncbi:ABC transporter ATP-binding protein [Synoicihabitans lomoniglobus]|uniref:ABC transporter ATP-binding protein n=1 Tax=Synoicihabitans lomoniglobus TaxID=2909285 RepID=A0AAF0CP45_9BACT|nr:ABC transporter ATP-binding protein/permease [Opitutaceae bacterium LMO-M01]WED65405.1 ABC transporter ATP-binding protein [Opitutaceae bacterium LMO-M01]
MSASASSPRPSPYTNAVLIRRLFGLAWRYRADCLKVLGLQLFLLLLGLSGLSFTGLGIDYIRYVLAQREVIGPVIPFPVGPLGLSLPPSWPPLQVVGLVAGAILSFALLRAVLNFSYTIAVNRLVQERLVVDLRGEIYEKLQRLSFRFFDANTTGSIISRVTGDVQAVRMFVDQVLIQVVIMGISLTIYIAYMARLSVSLTLACLATTPVLWVMSVIFSRHIQPRYAANRQLEEGLIHHFVESIEGAQVTKAFGREPEDRAAFDAKNDAMLRQQQGIFWRVSLFSPAVGFLTRVNIMVLLGYGGWLVIQGQLALGAGLVVFAGLLEQYSGQVNQVATLVNTIQQSLVGARRVFEILDAPIEVAAKPDATAHPRLRGEVRFDNIGFAYDGIDPVLRDIDLHVPAGRCIAILGATGAGKSVLMSLIPRFFDPTQGRLLLDGIDARDLRLDDLRRNIGIVFQESFLFSHTVAANIAFGHPDATREQVERAARIAAAHDFIMALPEGYDTVLGESGKTLSGGQRQRLALARAILLEPPILLLDDPTAAIDSETEHEIFTALDNAISGRTTFLVAHRVSTLRRADEIIVMENGRIVQRGTHDALVRQPGPYLKVARLQLIDAGEWSASPETGGAA